MVAGKPDIGLGRKPRPTHVCAWHWLDLDVHINTDLVQVPAQELGITFYCCVCAEHVCGWQWLVANIKQIDPSVHNSYVGQ